MVIGCDTTHDNKSILRHRFPKNKETCDIWVERTGNNKLLNKTVEQIFQSYVMCDNLCYVLCYDVLMIVV